MKPARDARPQPGAVVRDAGGACLHGAPYARVFNRGRLKRLRRRDARTVRHAKGGYLVWLPTAAAHVRPRR